MWVKVGEATRSSLLDFSSLSFGKIFETGKGTLNLCQVKLLPDNPKVKRMYSRMLANTGLKLRTNMLEYVKDEADYGIPYFMYIKKENHQDLDKMTAYFTSSNYILNNLGEGVYGWMEPADKKDGKISIPGSTGDIYFLTVFVDSEINRDPSKRTEYELPNEKIIPDLFVSTNAGIKVFVNGRECLDGVVKNGQTRSFKIEDVLLSKGVNRVALIVKAGKDDLKFNLTFKDKFGEFLTSGIAYKLTLD